MEKLTIGYEFEFTLLIRKRNGKVYKGHHRTGLGLDFRLALWDVYHQLKKSGTEITGITSVKPLRVAFAFDADLQTVKTSLEAYPPSLPDELDKELAVLPKKTEK